MPVADEVPSAAAQTPEQPEPAQPEPAPPLYPGGPPGPQQPSPSAVDYALAQELGEPAPGGANPAAALHTIATDPNASVSDRQIAWQQLSPEERLNLVNNADPNQLASIATAAMSPEELATIQVRHQQAQIHRASAEQLDIERQRDADARANFAAYQTVMAQHDADMAQVNKEAADIANTKIVVPHGVAFTALSMLGGALGGLAAKGAGLQGNPFIEGLDKGIEQNIALQRAQIEQRWKGLDLKKNLLAQQYMKTGDMYRAQETVRLAHYDSLIKQNQIEAQNYDPNGTTALALAQQTQQIQAQRAAAYQAMSQTLLKNKLDTLKVQNELAQQQETVRHNKAQEGLEWSKFGLEKSKASAEKAGEVISPEELATISQTTGIRFPAGVTRKEVNARLETQGKALETKSKQTGTAQASAAGRVLDVEGNPALGPDGKPIQVAPPVAEHANLIRAKGQVAIDEFSAARRFLASDPSTWDREGWAEAKGHLGNALVALAGTVGEKTSPKAIEELQKLFGDDYDKAVNRYRNKGEGGVGTRKIDAEIDSLVNNLSTEVKATTGVKTDAKFFKTNIPPKSAATEEDKRTAALATDYSKLEPESLSREDRAFREGQAVKTLGSGTKPSGSPEVNRAMIAGIAPSQLSVLDELSAAIHGTDEAARNKALEVLAVTAQKGANANIRAAAAKLIDYAASAGLASVPSGVSEEPEAAVR